MIKKNGLRKEILVLCMVIAFAGYLFKGNVLGQEDTHLIGGGYAASQQIPNAYFLPVLYNAENGLPTSEANCILATSDGYIWIGGYSGIVRYDGREFERLSVEDGLTSGRGLFEDSRGRIWVATNDNGVVVIDGQEKIHYSKAEGLVSNSIRTFAEDTEGNIFIGSTAGLAYVDTQMELHRIDDERVNQGRILRLDADPAGTVYGHTSNGEVFTVSTAGIGKFYTSDDLGMVKITTILADPEKAGWLYFGTSGSVVYHGRLGDRSIQMKKIETAPAENIHWLHYACGRLWVSSLHMAGYVDETDTFIPFERVPIKDSYEMMTSDFQGNMWFASTRYGVMKIVADHFLDLTGAAGMEPEVINATCMRKGDLYVGTDNGIRLIGPDYNPKENEITEYFGNTRVRCIMNDSKGNTWFSTFSDDMGLVCVDAEDKISTFTKQSGLPGYEIRCTYEKKDGSILVGTNSGIAVIRDGRVIRSYGSADGMNNTMVLTLSEGEHGEILAGTDGDGLYIIRGSSIIQKIGTQEGLSSDVVMRLKQDEKRNVLWIITSSHVEYMKNGKITTVTSFPYNNNFDVTFVGENDLWFFSSKGIYVIDAQAVIKDEITDYVLYDRANGLASIPVSYCYNTLDSDGKLYIAGENGVSVVNISGLCDFSNRTLIGVRSIYYDGEEMYPDETGTYHLPEKAGRIQINPAILDYTVSNPLVRVFLGGMEKEGITDTQNRLGALEYSRLKHGNYNLHIQILDKKTKEVTAEQVFRIIKKPAFFERWYVIVLFVLLTFVAFGLIVWRIMTGTVIRKQYLQLQEARDEAERANSAKSRFLANMSHEIRTPINTIMGMDEMILREDIKNVPKEYSGPVTDYARDIKTASESLLALVNDLLDISKMESGKMHLVEQEYDTQQFLREIIAMVRNRAEAKKLYFDLDIDETLPQRLYGDSGKIKQIVLNILTNAVKYTDEGGFVLSVKITERNAVQVSVRISVKDTGSGIREEDLNKLFNAYERLEEVKNSNIQGTGLGLDISRQFAEMMGGKLWCESVYGEGSEFILTMKQKIVDETAIGVFLEESEEVAEGGYKPQFIAPDADILVVDDTPMNLNVIKGLLKPTKVFVTTAKSGEECLEKIADNDFNVVLLDHMMPGLDGIETLEKIRLTHPDLPVYALTANATAGGEEFYRSKGFTGYLTKPVDIVAVEHAIMRHLPESMMMKPSGEDVTVLDNKLPDELLWLENAEGISVEEGIKNSGGASQFVFMLNMFYDSIDATSSEIETAYQEKDLKLATVKVHALKTTARIIGALTLSADCQALEDAGNRADEEFISANKDRLLFDHRAYKNILKGLKQKAKTDKPEIAETTLQEAYMALKEMIPQMDYDAVEMILTQVREYTIPECEEKLITALEENLKRVNWEQMEKLIAQR